MSNYCNILKRYKNIAVVGISRNMNRTSTSIAHYLNRNGYNIVGVNPNATFVNSGDIKVYNSLRDILHEIDIVNVFRKSEDIPDIIDDVFFISPKVLWLQLGIRNDQAVSVFLNTDTEVIHDTCIKVEHSFCF